MAHHIDPESCPSHMTVPVRVMHCNSQVKSWKADLNFMDASGQNITIGQLKRDLLGTAGIPPDMTTRWENCRLYLQMDNDDTYAVELQDHNSEMKKQHVIDMCKPNSYLLITDGVDGLESFRVKAK